MRILFMGTPDFAVPSLEALIQAGHTVVGAFTQPDKPKNRGMKLLPTPVILGAVFGAYFCFFVPTRLPELYDKYSLNLVSDGIFRMNVPGVRFHNGNWPHIVTVGRAWSCAVMVLMPLVNLTAGLLLPERGETIVRWMMLALTLGGLFVPMYVVGKK